MTVKHDRWRVIKNHNGFESDLIYLRKNNATQKRSLRIKKKRLRERLPHVQDMKPL